MMFTTIPSERLEPNVLRTALGSLIALSLTAPASAQDAEAQPETIHLTGIVRDFRERSAESGHTDMERRPAQGFGLYAGNVAPLIGADRKPVFTGNGFKVRHPWRDSVNRPICHLLYDPSRGDIEGLTGVSDQGAIESAESFATWFNDVPGVNLSIPLSIKMIRQDDGTYVFDDKDDPTYVDLGGFFPLEDQLFGNSGGSPDRNFHFTFELHCEFEYDAAAGQVFEFVGDDDVWVFINDKLVIDLGGVHSAENQFVDLARLPGLEDGETYRLDFFFAERHRTQSNFRIQTNIAIRSLDTPMLTAIFD